MAQDIRVPSVVEALPQVAQEQRRGDLTRSTATSTTPAIRSETGSGWLRPQELKLDAGWFVHGPRLPPLLTRAGTAPNSSQGKPVRRSCAS